MTLAEFIDKILKPIAGVIGFLLAYRFSSQFRSQIKPEWKYPLAAVVVLALGAIKWFF